jgi:hypothetical protein
MSYGADQNDIFRLAAFYVDRLKPRSLNDIWQMHVNEQVEAGADPIKPRTQLTGFCRYLYSTIWPGNPT